jgi:hypothetical protein
MSVLPEYFMPAAVTDVMNPFGQNPVAPDPSAAIG